MARKIQVKRGAKANIPVLDQGEFGFTTDIGSEELYIGNGSENIQLARQDRLDSHAAQHAPGGSDPITVAMVGARKSSGLKHSAQVNADTFLTEGSYIAGGAANNENANAALNLPAACGYFSINVYATLNNIDNGCIQVAYTRDTGDMYIRHRLNGAWNAWKKFATTDYAVNRGGGTMTGALTVRSGWPVLRSQDSTNNRMSDFQSTGMGATIFGRHLTDQSFRALIVCPPDCAYSDGALQLWDSTDTATPFRKVLHAGNSNLTRLVSTETTPTENNEINWTYE